MATDFAHFFDLSLDLLCTVDPSGRFQELNPAWTDHLGYLRDDLRGADVANFVHAEDRPGHAETMERVTGGAPMVHYESRFRSADGTYRWLSWTMNFHPGDALAYCVARDVTRHREAMAERDRTIEEAQRLQTELMRRTDQQQEVLSAMGTPIIQVWDDVITLPIVGVIDSMRATEMKEQLLHTVARTGARIAIVDLTAVDMVDTATADHIVRLMQGVQLLGAQGIITGIQPAVAQIIVNLGVDLGGIMTLRSLREGLRYSLQVLGYRVLSPEE
jgi:PAS domain S-box-containing protein